MELWVSDMEMRRAWQLHDHDAPFGYGVDCAFGLVRAIRLPDLWRHKFVFMAVGLMFT